MSADTYFVIRCDARDEHGEQCDTEHHWPVRVENHTELRRLLKNERGWGRNRNGEDFCPPHNATRRQTS